MMHHRECIAPPPGIFSFGPRIQQKAKEAVEKTSSNEKNWQLCWLKLYDAIIAELEFRCAVVEQRKELRADEVEVLRWVKKKGRPEQI